MTQPVVVGIDGSPSSGRALAVALELATSLGSEVVAVHAVGLLDRSGAEPVISQQHRTEIEASFASDWTAMLEGAAVPVRRLLLDGDPVRVLLDTAAAEDARYIVTGRRGAGGRTQRLLGSTSAQLADHAEVPVVIVP